MLSQAHEDLARAAQRVVTALDQAHAGAPRAPGLFHRVLHDVGNVAAFPMEVVKGVGVGVWGMVDGVYQLVRMAGTEIDPYAYYFDHSAWEANNTKYSDIYAAVTEHPGKFAETMGKSLVAWDEWGRNPGEALGSLLPTAFLALVTGGGAVRGLRASAEASAEAKKLAGADAAARAAQQVGFPGNAPGVLGQPGPGTTRSLSDLYANGRVPTEAQLRASAEGQGWTLEQSPTGPAKYVDENGVPRLTIKAGSSRTPGSGGPHIEVRDPGGQRTDPFGNPVARRSTSNHLPYQP